MPEDSIFAESSDPAKSAGLGVGEFPWDTFARGYRLAAEKLLESFRNPVDLEAVCYPLLFNARHFVELRMKDIISCASFSFDGLSETFKEHSLSPLLSRLRELAERVEPISDLDWWRPIDECVRTFDRFDRGSFSFRYPVNKEGKAQLLELLDFDIEQFAERFSIAADRLDAVADEFHRRVRLRREAAVLEHEA